MVRPLLARSMPDSFEKAPHNGGRVFDGPCQEHVGPAQQCGGPAIRICCVPGGGRRTLSPLMPMRLRSFRRLVTLALPCWLLGGPLASTLQSVAACPHQGAMHHDTGSQAPCWCSDMSGVAAIETPNIPAALPEPAERLDVVLWFQTLSAPRSRLVPSSPAFPPTPPPPNGRA